MKEQARFDTFFTYGFPVVEVSGDLDLTNMREFGAALELAAGADRGSVIVYLGRTTYFDSQAIHVLLRFAEHLAITRQRLVVVVPRAALPRRILEIAGLTQAFPVFDNMQEAVAAAQPAWSQPASDGQDRPVPHD